MKRSRARRKSGAWKRAMSRPPPPFVSLDRTARDAGYRDYRDYVHSEHWTLVRLCYARAWPGCSCVACGSDRWQLHHVNYYRLGREMLHDLIPLCVPCHEKLHACHKRDRIPVYDYRRGMAYAFGWSPEELARRLEGFHAMSPGAVVH